MVSMRIISGLIFFALFLLGLFAPGFGWALPIILLGTCLAGIHEFMHFGQSKPQRPFITLAQVGATALLADAYFFQLDHALLIIGLVIVVAMALGLLYEKPNIAEMAGLSVIGMFYVAFPLALIFLIWLKPLHAAPLIRRDAQHYLIFLVATTWSSDIGAFFLGRFFGKHKLAPRISPGKTVEGFIGGILMTVLVAVCMKLFWNNIDRIFNWTEVLALAILFSVIGPIGDLAESRLKRNVGIKDSGRTFTGHGGMLDIIDSLLFTTIFYYGFLLFFHPNVIAYATRP